MPTYVAFLRAVNVRPRWVKMELLRKHLSENGFTEVETHIQSGNVLVRTPMRSVAKVQARLHDLLSAEFGFDIPVVVRTPEQLRALVEKVDAEDSPLSAQARVYVVVADGRISPPAADALAAWDGDGERAKGLEQDVILWLDVPANSTRLTNTRLERLTSRVTTTRDIKVLRALAQKWGT